MRTTSGIDFQAGVLGNPSANGAGAFAPASYIAVSTDSTTPKASDVSLPGEIVSGALVRQVGTYSHTVGTSSYTLSALFVSDQTVTLAKIGVLNAATGGTLFLETLLQNAATLNPGDQIQVTEVVNL